MVDRSPTMSPRSGSTVDGETREIQSYMVFGTTFDVDANYTVVDAVGQGAYGIVWYVVAALLIGCLSLLHAALLALPRFAFAAPLLAQRC